MPSRQGQWWYYARAVEGAQYPVHCRCPAVPDDGTVLAWTPPEVVSGVDLPGEQVILDCNVRAEGHDFYALGGLEISPDGSLMAFLEDVTGDERFTLRYRRPDTGEYLTDEVPELSYDIVLRRRQQRVLRRRGSGLAPVPGPPTRPGHAGVDGRRGVHRTQRAILGRRRAQHRSGLFAHRLALADDQRGVRPAAGRPDRRTGERRGAPGRRRVPGRSRHDRRSRGVRGGAQRQCRGLRRRSGRGR